MFIVSLFVSSIANPGENDMPRMRVRDLVYSLRLSHWVKGVFVYFPLVFGRKIFEGEAFANATKMFVFFCFASSAMYLINDVFDIAEDRTHPQKSKRPIASGKITVPQALSVAIIMIAVVIPMSFVIGTVAGVIISAYIILNYLYARYLKHAVIIDVFCLGAFFYLRIMAGAAASGVVLSNWILICTVLLALFLGFNKRRYDIDFSKNDRPVMSKYDKYFLDRMISVIASSLVMAYSLYVIDPETIRRFGTNHLLYTIPFVYYGIFRYMYLLDTKWFGGDPVRILFADYKLQISIAIWLVLSVGIIYFHV
jgi:4-hydroxybenzoate polyprenyltransferase